MKTLLFVLLIHCIAVSNLFAQEIHRKILVLVPKGIELNLNSVHLRLESILNHYGFFAEHIEEDPKNYPEDISSYAGIIYWNQGLIVEDPIKLVKFLARFKDKKNIFIGDIPMLDENEENHSNRVNQILNKTYGFEFGNFWKSNPQGIKQAYDSTLFGFEMKISFFNQKYFTYIKTNHPKHEIVFKETYKNKDSNSAFFAPWGFYAPINKVYFEKDNENIEGKNRWIINPFKLIEKVYDVNYPIPDTTTINGKRIAYIHIDGDGILSTAFNQKYAIETGHDFIEKRALKTGVSFVVSELDKDAPIPNYNPLLQINNQKKEL